MEARKIIQRKRDGAELSIAELTAFANGAALGSWSPAQLGAMLMAIVLRGMSLDEAKGLTLAMKNSGECLDFSGLREPVVDKHSTGGVGDKVSLVLAPLAAACGLRVPMLSGRGLGHTGGTLDKLEAIPGFRTRLSRAEIEAQVAEIGVVMAGQTEFLVPADRVLYSLRDETGTVESLPLITASILSKKLAAGLQALVLDVKYGRGAFMPTLEMATELANMMVDLGTAAGCRVGAWLTRMDEPLGRAIGNAVEVAESIELLQGGGPQPLRDLILDLVAGMLVLGHPGTSDAEGREIARQELANGNAWERFCRMVVAQGGDPRVLKQTGLLPQAPVCHPVEFAGAPAWVSGIDSRILAEAVLDLGAGRKQASDRVDPATGISGLVAVGERIEPGQLLGWIHAPSKDAAAVAAAALHRSIQLSAQPVQCLPLVTRILR